MFLKYVLYASLIISLATFGFACGDDKHDHDHKGDNPPAANNNNAGDDNNNAGDDNNNAGDDNNNAGDDNNQNQDPTVTVPTTYSFETQFDDLTGSSVSYGGQIQRHILIWEIKNYLSNLSEQIDGPNYDGEAGDVLSKLIEWYNFDGDNDTMTTSILSAEELTENKIGLIGQKKLSDKIAGVNPDVAFAGWTTDLPVPQWASNTDADPHTYTGDVTVSAAKPIDSATELVLGFFQMVDELAVARDNDEQGYIPGTTDPLPSVYLNDRGHDLAQLIQKFLLGAVTLNQGLGKYLALVEGKDNTENYKGDNTKKYTAMEHYWDEAFGYFGAARNYNDYTDDEIAGKGGRETWKGKHDTNQDGKIDLTSEYNFGNSVNCAKRDRGATTTSVDFTRRAFNAWLRGRAIITAHHGKEFDTWSDAMKTDLQLQITTIGKQWEGAVAATVIHYINDTLGDMAKCGTVDDPATPDVNEGYSYADHAKHWGEMKGFALGLKYNPNSPLHAELQSYCYNVTSHQVTEGETEDDCGAGNVFYPASSAFVRLHTMFGDAPILCNADVNLRTGYQMTLQSARSKMTQWYEFTNDDASGW